MKLIKQSKFLIFQVIVYLITLNTQISFAQNKKINLKDWEGSYIGIGVANLLAENGIFDKGLKFRSMILPDIFIDQDTPERMYDVAGLNAKHIAQKVLEVFFSKDGIRVIK